VDKQCELGVDQLMEALAAHLTPLPQQVIAYVTITAGAQLIGFGPVVIKSSQNVGPPDPASSFPSTAMSAVAIAVAASGASNRFLCESKSMCSSKRGNG